MQLDNRVHYKPLRASIVKNTQARVNGIIDEMNCGKHIDDMTKKWLSQTPNPPRIPISYTLTKIHKPIPVGRSIIRTLSKPRRQRGRGKTKDLIGRTVAQHVRIKTLYFLSRLLQNNNVKSPQFESSGNQNRDGKLF